MIEREPGYFRKNRRRMRYHEMKEQGFPIGSGVVEAANRTLVAQRMKRSGLRWSIVGGQAVPTFRALLRTGRFYAAWRAMMDAPAPANDKATCDAETALAA